MSRSVALFFAALVILQSCRHLSNSIVEVKLECGADADPNLSYFKILSPVGEELTGENLKVFNLKDDAIGPRPTILGCISHTVDSKFAITSESKLWRWGVITNGLHINEKIPLKKIEHWNPKKTCSEITVSSGVLRLPLDWDKSIAARLEYSVSLREEESKKGNEQVRIADDRDIFIPESIADGPLSLSLESLCDSQV